MPAVRGCPQPAAGSGAPGPAPGGANRPEAGLCLGGTTQQSLPGLLAGMPDPRGRHGQASLRGMWPPIGLLDARRIPALEAAACGLPNGLAGGAASGLVGRRLPVTGSGCSSGGCKARIAAAGLTRSPCPADRQPHGGEGCTPASAGAAGSRACRRGGLEREPPDPLTGIAAKTRQAEISRLTGAPPPRGRVGVRTHTRIT
jgi:hypothetical protein